MEFCRFHRALAHRRRHPLEIYEAMAAQIPVVSTTIGAEGLSVNPPRDIRLADSPQDFASHCLELLASSELRARQAHAAWEMVNANFFLGARCPLLRRSHEKRSPHGTCVVASLAYATFFRYVRANSMYNAQIPIEVRLRAVEVEIADR